MLLKLKPVNPACADNFCIRAASENGHLEVVKVLLQDPRVDPAAVNNYAIKNASYPQRVSYDLVNQPDILEG